MSHYMALEMTVGRPSRPVVLIAGWQVDEAIIGLRQFLGFLPFLQEDREDLVWRSCVSPADLWLGLNTIREGAWQGDDLLSDGRWLDGLRRTTRLASIVVVGPRRSLSLAIGAPPECCDPLNQNVVGITGQVSAGANRFASSAMLCSRALCALIVLAIHRSVRPSPIHIWTFG